MMSSKDTIFVLKDCYLRKKFRSKIYRTVRNVVFCVFVVVGMCCSILLAASNSYVSVTTSSGRVICLGSDFLIIPEDPFSDIPIQVYVSAQIGWILKSSSTLTIVPGGASKWKVDGDSDNPEDSASGRIYVAKVVLSSDVVELSRLSSTNVVFTTHPSFARQYIVYNIKPMEQTLRVNLNTDGGLPSQDVVASVRSGDGLLVFNNTIPKDRRESGKDSQAFYFEAEKGREKITVNLKKNLNDVYRFIEKDITEACKDIISPKKLASALIKSNLKKQVDDFDVMPKDWQNVYLSAFDKVAASASEIFPDSINVFDFTAEYKDKIKPEMIIDEGWEWRVSLLLDTVFNGGAVSFSPKRDFSLLNWSNAIIQAGGFDSHLFDYQCTKVGAKISVDGHSAIGTCPIKYRFSFTAIKQFEDFGDFMVINSGVFSFSLDFNISISF